MKNPLSWLVLAATSWILVLGLNQAWISLGVIVLAQLVALLRLRNLSVPVATLALAIPVGLSLLVVHVPFGSQRLAPLITADGLVTAGELGLRFVALMSAFLAAAAMITVPQLAKAVQGGRLAGPRLAYIVGSAVQLLPQGRDAWAAIRDANTLRGRNTRGPVRAVRHVAVPLITRLLGPVPPGPSRWKSPAWIAGDPAPCCARSRNTVMNDPSAGSCRWWRSGWWRGSETTGRRLRFRSDQEVN